MLNELLITSLWERGLRPSLSEA